MSERAAPASNLPSAAIVSMRSLDHRPLGLVLVLAGLLAVSKSLGSAAVVFVRGSVPGELAAMLLAQVAVDVLQVLAGFAIIRRRLAALAFGAYLTSALALLVLAAIVMRDDLGQRQLVALALEVVGVPLLLLLAPRLFGVRHLTTDHAIGGVLIVAGIAAWVAQPLLVIDQVRALLGGHARAGAWLGSLLRPAISLAIATVGLLAGLRMAAGQPPHRALRVYVIVSLVIALVMNLGLLVFAVVEETGYLKFTLPGILIRIVTGVVTPLVIWFYAQPELADRDRPAGAALPWVALCFVPSLLARCLLFDDIDRAIGRGLAVVAITMCGAQAVATMVAAGASLRGDRSSRTWWLVAATIAAVLLALVAYAVFTLERAGGGATGFFELSLLFSTAATAAWFARKVPSH